MCMGENNPNYVCSVMGSKRAIITRKDIFEWLWNASSLLSGAQEGKYDVRSF